MFLIEAHRNKHVDAITQCGNTRTLLCTDWLIRDGNSARARPLLLLCPAGATLAPLDAGTANATFAFARSTYEAAGAADILRIVPGASACADPDAVAGTLFEWALSLSSSSHSHSPSSSK